MAALGRRPVWLAAAFLALVWTLEMWSIGDFFVMKSETRGSLWQFFFTFFAFSIDDESQPMVR